jgi:hypothetical protein
MIECAVKGPRAVVAAGAVATDTGGPMRPDDTTREIPLTRGRVALVDAADFEMLSHWNWHVSVGGYAVTTIWGHDRRRQDIFMHRFLMLPEPEQIVHHVNGLGADNRRNNLRVCSASQNMQVRGKYRGASVYKGVHWAVDRNRWRVCISLSGRNISVGTFRDEIDAALAYDRSAIEHFGRFATTNFLTG